MRVTINYLLFAVIATMANIGSQELIIRIYDGRFSVTLSILTGTFVGLVVKYILDKKYIFKYQVNSMAQDTKTFLLYTTMGLVTTAIFWGFEFGFDLIFKTKSMRYLGGVVGLSIGYYIKYQLDKKYVFN